MKININIYSSSGFIDCDNIKFFIATDSIDLTNLDAISGNMTSFGVKKIKKADYLSEPRICELECFKNSWRDISYFPDYLIILNKFKGIFEPFFVIDKILYEDVGYFIFKVILTAVKKGKIENKEEIGIKLKIVGENEIIKNEVKKNNLIFERSNTLEMRVGDLLMFYLSHSK
jgi:hypothetical protein